VEELAAAEIACRGYMVPPPSLLPGHGSATAASSRAPAAAAAVAAPGAARLQPRTLRILQQMRGFIGRGTCHTPKSFCFGHQSATIRN
jgi:hypothetical protein